MYDLSEPEIFKTTYFIVNVYIFTIPYLYTFVYVFPACVEIDNSFVRCHAVFFRFMIGLAEEFPQ